MLPRKSHLDLVTPLPLLRVNGEAATATAGRSSSPEWAWSVPLVLTNRAAGSATQPMCCGLPFPKNRLKEPKRLVLLDNQERQVPLQTQVLSRWSDGSVQWLLLDFLAKALAPGQTPWSLQERRCDHQLADEGDLHVYETENGVTVATGAATFHLNQKIFQPFQQVVVNERDLLGLGEAQTRLADLQNRLGVPRITRVYLEDRGNVRATLRFEATFTGRVRARLLARLCFFAGTGLVRMRLTLHNPNRARHAGGLWDLGDPGSMFFKEFSLQLNLDALARERLSWTADSGATPRTGPASRLEIYQESSGGPNWQSRNHVNRHGRVPLTFRGYRVRTGDAEEFGLRANPGLALHGPAGGVSVAVPEFWQQFPKALELDGPALRVGLFPSQFADGFELQGGERKTHTLWLDFTSENQPSAGSLDWVHEPAEVLAPPAWYAESGALGPFGTGFEESQGPLDLLLAEVSSGPHGLITRREIIDEFGWRNFGELYADHEGEHYTGPEPVISHYNNQYDGVLGSLLHYLRTGDSVWWQVGDPLARHVIDIDRYHTTKDKAAYNGGLFWFTDHYVSAETCTHRTYSRANRPAIGRDYGGGPGSNHNFTSGLQLYYFLTGDPEAKAAVVGLADWVLAMDDGRKNILGLLDGGPTGLVSSTGTVDYHGPGRGAGNSVNALLDAWLLTGQSHYQVKAESLIRRCIHPRDDIAARDLLNVEKRWSYTVFLVVLDRYLRLKAERAELDGMYAYAQESLLAYTCWMLENEIPYFDQREKLEYPTEAWAGQELRKANVLRLAAAHADEQLRSSLLRRSAELAARAWADMRSFESRTTTRAAALVMVEGLLDQALQNNVAPAPQAQVAFDHGNPEIFVPQKRRVLERLKSSRGVAATLLHVVNPYRWLALAWQL